VPGVSETLRLLRTVRHLRPQQIAGQLRVRAFAALGPARAAALGRRRVPPWPGLRRGLPEVQTWLAPGGGHNSRERILGGELCFLNQARQVGFPPRFEQPQASRLWQYNLHYLEYLWPLDFEQARELALAWIEQHPASAAGAGWEPYPTSLRIGNLCAVFFRRFASETLADPELRDRLWRSLWQQGSWLSAHLETHIAGNHLLENAIALALLGACFDGPDAAAFRGRGGRLLRAQLEQQVLADGGHFERSPMYHLRLVYALALLCHCADAELRELVAPALERACAALRCLLHPDGQIALLNDSAFGIYGDPTAVLEFAAAAVPACREQSRPCSCFALADTGYYGARNAAPGGQDEGQDGGQGGAHYILCDAAPIAADHQPGHAHADLFGFELSLHGRRLIVDSGVFDYEDSAERRHCRSTAAHNTVVVDGRDQCELWGVFRVGRRGRPREVDFRCAVGGFRLEAWHDGYTWLDAKARHRRRFAWHPEGVLLVRDAVEAKGELHCESFLHLHPEVELLELRADRASLGLGEHRVQILFAGGGRLRATDREYFPEFGKRMAARALVYEWSSSTAATGFCIGRDIEAFDVYGGARVGGRLLDFA